MAILSLLRKIILARIIRIATLLPLLAMPVLAQSPEALSGRWRVVSASPAPWYKGPLPDAYLERAGIIFSKDGLKGMAPLTCLSATQSWHRVGVEGLFEGGLPQADAVRLARELGLPAGQDGVMTARFACENAGFDFHMSGPDRLLFALDNVIYTARRVDVATSASDTAFLQPAWPALDCGLAEVSWEKLVCAYPETSVAHAVLSRSVYRLRAATPANPLTGAFAQKGFLLQAARFCRALAIAPTPAEAAERAACLMVEYDKRREALETGTSPASLNPDARSANRKQR